MKKRRILTKTVAAVSAAAMAFSMISYIPFDYGTYDPYIIQASALTPDSEYTTDSNGLMSYRILDGRSDNSCRSTAPNSSVDLLGAFNDTWKMVCYGNSGFRSVLRIGEKCYYPDLVTGSSTQPTISGSSLVTEDCGLGVKFNPVFVNDGKLLQMVYEVTNTSSSAITFDFGIGADVQIGGCDDAPIKKLDKTSDGQETGFLMESTYSSDSMTDENGNTVYAGFGLIMNGASGANASDYWFGPYGQVYYDSNIFSLGAPENDLTDGTDSGALVSWKNRTAAPGETVKLSIYVGIGSAEELQSIIKEMLKAAADYKNEQLTDLEPNSLYEFTITDDDGNERTFQVTSSPDGTIPMTGYDNDGNPYSLIGKTVKIVRKGDGTTTEDSDPLEIEIAGRPDAPDDPSAPTGTPQDLIEPYDIETTTTSITFPGVTGQEYTIDGGQTWVSADSEGNVVFENLTPSGEYTINTRFAATDSAPASYMSAGVNVTLKDMISDDDIIVNAEDLVFTGDVQNIEVTCDDPDVTITYSLIFDGDYTETPPELVDEGVYTVYYCATKDGCYPKYGSYTVTIIKTYQFNENEHWKVVDDERVDVGNHTFGAWKTVNEPNCTEDGKKKHICSVCGYYEFETVPTAGHDWDEENWSHNENYHWHECLNADCPISDDSEKLGYGEHEYTVNDINAEGAFVSAADCEHPAVYYASCICGVLSDTVTFEYGSPKGHTLVKTERIEATCTGKGNIEYWTCTVCGKLFADENGTTEITDTIIDENGHMFSADWSSDDEYHWHICLNGCGEISGKDVHSFGEWKITKNPTPEADGIKERICTVCKRSQLGTVKYVPDDNDDETGDIENITDADDNACHADIIISKREIIEKFDLTPEEREAIENGDTIYIYLEVNDAENTVSQEDKNSAEKALTEGMSIGTYLDLSLYKQVGNNAPSKVENTNGSITITFDMPEALKKDGRTYCMIRVHNGDADILPVDYRADTGKASFETDRFSSYAIAYTDAEENNDDDDDIAFVPGWIKPLKPEDDPFYFPHTERYTTKYDAESHWQECVCGEIKDKEKHVFGEWVTDENGKISRTCKVCGYTEESAAFDVSAGEGVYAENLSANNISASDIIYALITFSMAAALTAYELCRRKAKK
ncbi:MAG: hypothetical protein ACI4JJ_02345 [Huintestinicola sp.]